MHIAKIAVGVFFYRVQHKTKPRTRTITGRKLALNRFRKSAKINLNFLKPEIILWPVLGAESGYVWAPLPTPPVDITGYVWAPLPQAN
jgi:hypothetical protein